jgi:hypothetical protein
MQLYNIKYEENEASKLELQPSMYYYPMLRRFELRLQGIYAPRRLTYRS